ncbi:MAG: hypothetical protein HN793_01855 [Rhodospirillaceae bacterium]|jgi:hypothetical protein|nr:hypothetical protein [Rhodospirillaceae bacterium]MBT5242427.1 hypothetical protein [Rhodospirillaceae bacterium]MBT5565265.1 hypothetical protein [Rhodospirillaceae bacterium]MBT6091123.1 hypothetical protein [Rhodospirillaceae bacterium]MBT6961069.1 hypothetical protein [Rhodospirillaceae bacterium]
MSKGLFAFFISLAVSALIAVLAFGLDWDGFFSDTDTAQTPSTMSTVEVEKIIKDWPVAIAATDQALKEYRAIGGSRGGEAAVSRGVQANMYARQGWVRGRAEFMISYLFMLRNSILKYSDQHRTLGYFMEHYEQNSAVSVELKSWQIDQIDQLLKQINKAPDLSEYPPGDVELMVRYFDRFHAMLVGYGRPPGFSQRQASR